MNFKIPPAPCHSCFEWWQNYSYDDDADVDVDNCVNEDYCCMRWSILNTDSFFLLPLNPTTNIAMNSFVIEPTCCNDPTF